MGFRRQKRLRTAGLSHELIGINSDYDSACVKEIESRKDSSETEQRTDNYLCSKSLRSMASASIASVSGLLTGDETETFSLTCH